jgi:hypothetical protein
MISCCQSMDPVRSNQVHPYMQKGVILKVAPNSNKSASVTFHYCYQQTKLSLQPSFLIMISTTTATAHLVGSDDCMPTCVLGSWPFLMMEWNERQHFSGCLEGMQRKLVYSTSRRDL